MSRTLKAPAPGKLNVRSAADLSRAEPAAVEQQLKRREMLADAAPALYEALMGLMARTYGYAKMHGDDARQWEAMKAARAVLAKVAE